jgi:ATP-dependent DNA helicase PIF1
MHNLLGESKVYEAKDGGSQTDVAQRTKLLENCLAPESIHLKKGAQVMLIKNIDETLVNGSLGKVIGFMSETTFDNYQRNEEEYYATQSGEGGEPSTGLSEAKTRIQDMVAGTAQTFPVVRFAIADGTTRDLLCQREQWKVEQPNGEIVASRSQIPLILAWALSIHKAQGQTLERVKVDLGKVFEKGQAYVALSRATSMAGLQVLRFDPKKVMAHETVRTFYAGLSKAEASMADGGTAGAKSVVTEKAKKSRMTKAEDYERGFVEDEWEV